MPDVMKLPATYPPIRTRASSITGSARSRTSGRSNTIARSRSRGSATMKYPVRANTVATPRTAVPTLPATPRTVPNELLNRPGRP